MDDPYSVAAARAAAEDARLADWVGDFLRSPGSDNADLADQLAGRAAAWLGPVEVPIGQLNRLAGPPGEPVLVTTDEGDWRDDVDDLAQRIEQGLEPPPVVAVWRSDLDQLVLEDGNHRVEALRRAGRDRTWAVIAFDDRDQRDRFVPTWGEG
ncbi:MAG: hypothetical protein ACLGIC_06575 [Acidimicrobiia bacterium]